LTVEWKFPDVGEGLHEAQIVKWYHHEGDDVKRDEPLLDVETDKSVVTIGAPVTGSIDKVLFREGDTVNVGEVVVAFSTDQASSEKGTESTVPQARSEVTSMVGAGAVPSGAREPAVGQAGKTKRKK